MMLSFRLNLSLTIFANQPGCVPIWLASPSNTSMLISSDHAVGNGVVDPDALGDMEPVQALRPTAAADRPSPAKSVRREMVVVTAPPLAMVIARPFSGFLAISL